MDNTIVATTIPLTEDQRAAYKEEIRKELEGEQKKKKDKSKDSEPYYKSWVDKFNHAMDAQKFKGSSGKTSTSAKSSTAKSSGVTGMASASR
tara:strand:- start:1300 stop:1575 length:276 start_codon:yes stop_codon:yes gene_type:complete